MKLMPIFFIQVIVFQKSVCWLHDPFSVHTKNQEKSLRCVLGDNDTFLWKQMQ